MMQVEFKITEAMVDRFAELTGDTNSLHMDEQYARRTQFRERLSHGMLPFSYLATYQYCFPNQNLNFTKLKGKFVKPIHIGQKLILSIKEKHRTENSISFSASWTNAEDKITFIRCEGIADLVPAQHSQIIETSSEPWLIDKLQEKVRSLKEMDGLDASLKIRLGNQNPKDYLESFHSDLTMSKDRNTYFSPALKATLMLSTLVGMELPGRYATFSKFELNFENKSEAIGELKLDGKVEAISKATETIDVSLNIHANGKSFGKGKLQAVVNRAPSTGLTCEEIKASHLQFGLSGKVALISGGSRGIGAATSKMLAMQGAKVAINYFKGQADSNALVQEIQSSGGEAIALPCDIRNESEVKNMVDQVVKKFGRLDILINNAVKDATAKSVPNITWEGMLEEMEISLKGLHTLCLSALPHFKQIGAGKIINISTIFVENPVSGQARYITVKSAVEGYTKALAKEYASDNIQVNLVVPNMVETDLVSHIPAIILKKIAAERPMGRNLQPIEVAKSISFLASNWTNGMTGQKIVLNLGD